VAAGLVYYRERLQGESPGTAGAMERTATADLWQRTLTQIPSIFGRLVYLSSLRDLNTGRYEHHGLALVYGAEQAHLALAQSHERTFAEWLRYSLEQQKADLDLYLSSLLDTKRTVVETWLRLAPYRNLVPTSVRDVERQLYLSDLEALLELLKNEYGASCPDPDA
jgi:hypothetical protein